MLLGLIAQSLLSGVVNGLIYALVGFGIAAIFRGSHIANVMQGEFSVVGAVIPNVYCCGAAAASSIGGLASNGAFGMLAGKAVAAALDDEAALVRVLGDEVVRGEFLEGCEEVGGLFDRSEGRIRRHFGLFRRRNGS